MTSAINWEQFSDEQLARLLKYLESTQSGQAHPVKQGRRSAAKREILVAYYQTLKTSDNIAGDTAAENAANTACKIVSGLDEKKLREYCLEQLPEYMCPTRFVAVNAFPTLPNGKLSYPQLPLPVHPDRNSSRGEEIAKIDGENIVDIAAENQDPDATKLLLTLLGKILNMDDVRSSDNFFEIGGDSITAIQFISKARENGLRIDVADVSQSSTIAEMGTRCEYITACEDQLSSKTTQLNDTAEQNRFAASGLNEKELDEFLDSFE